MFSRVLLATLKGQTSPFTWSSILAASKMDDLKDMTAHKEIEALEDLHEYKTNEGYVIDAGDEAYDDLKLARDVSNPYPYPLQSVNAIMVLFLWYTRHSLRSFGHGPLTAAVLLCIRQHYSNLA
jgi:hypothetical protein